MRTCAKMRCESEPVATVSLRYDQREVTIADLRPDRYPDQLDLCREHAERMTPPVGWSIQDLRATALVR